MRRFVMIALAISVASASAQTSLPGSSDERERLLRSLETACAGLSEEQQWPEADACRRAWFAEHEEAVWRLRMTPHLPQPQPPA